MLPSRLDVETATVRAELGRVDTKAGLLLTLASAALSGGLAVLGTGKLTGPAAVAGWVTVGLVAVGVLLLGASVWPRLGGGHGLMLWAAAADADDLVRVMTGSVRQQRAHGLLSLSQAARGKYRQVQAGMAVLGLALVAAIVTAALAALS
uniref:Pycsar system effector family protein n=1 Tax=Micromonospora carbonacea TaxID=47853 RepID=UPI003B225ECE